MIVVLAAALCLNLTQAISTALVRNPAYQEAQAQARSVRGVLTQAHAARFPTLDIGDAHRTVSSASLPTFSFLYPLPNGQAVAQTATLGSPTQDELSVALQLVLYHGGAISAGIGAATVEYSAAIAHAAAVRADITNQTTRAYYALIAAERGVTIAHEALDIADTNVRIALRRVQAGTAARADLLRQQLGQAQARSNVIDADNAVQSANLQLVRVTALDPSTTIEPASDADMQRDVPSEDLAAMLKSAQERRPELRVADEALEAARYAVRIARSSGLPTITLGAEESNTRPALIGSTQPQLTAELRATWRLFDGGLTRGKGIEAQASVDAAQLAFEELKRDVELEVRSSYLSYASALAKLPPADSAKSFADESLRVAQIRFKAGVGTALELSDALLADTQARTAFITAQAYVRIALSDLQRAAGELSG